MTVIRPRTAALAAAVAATALLGTMVATSSASATPPAEPPTFLAAEDLPPVPDTTWQAGEVTEQAPEIPVFCLPDTLPNEAVWHRAFSTDRDASALQLSVVTDSAAQARELAAEFEQALADCAATYEADYPGSTAEGRDLGALDVEDGAHGYGVATETEYGATDVNLFGVGRDGATVTVVTWGQMGGFEDVTVDPFLETTKTAVSGLYS